MKLQKIKFKGGILDDLLLDFTTENNVANIIVLAGENGTGKTTILDMIPAFQNEQTKTVVESIDFQLTEEDVNNLILLDKSSADRTGYAGSNLPENDFSNSPSLRLERKGAQYNNLYVAKISETKKFDYLHNANNLSGNAVQLFFKQTTI